MGVLTDEFCYCIQVQIRYWSYLFRRAGELPLCNFAGKTVELFNLFDVTGLYQSWWSLLLSCRSCKSWGNLFCSLCECTDWTVSNACVLCFCSTKKSATVGWSRVTGDSAHRDPRNCCMRSSANYCCLRLLSNVLVGHRGIHQVASFLPLTSICVVEVVNCFISSRHHVYRLESFLAPHFFGDI